MSLIDLMKARYSVRQYQSTPVEEEKLMAVLEAGRVAPTAANRQALIVCADKSEAWVRPIDQKDSCDIDASIVTDHMMLRATELGLGSLWICMFDPEIVRKEFALPENIVPVNILVLGYADCEPASPDRHDTARKALEETVRFC